VGYLFQIISTRLASIMYPSRGLPRSGSKETTPFPPPPPGDRDFSPHPPSELCTRPKWSSRKKMPPPVRWVVCVKRVLDLFRWKDDGVSFLWGSIVSLWEKCSRAGLRGLFPSPRVYSLNDFCLIFFAPTTSSPLWNLPH